MATLRSTYDESSIRVLKGLEPVRLRPGQFTRTDNPLHIVQEAIDNAVDEAIAGFARHVSVTVHPDQSVSVADDGRGIPVGPHPVEAIPVVQAIFTVLYSGGKFDKTTGAGAYTYAGGLHGVGVSVTNALSRRLECEVRRDGKLHRIVFQDGDVHEKLVVKGKASGTGTTVRVYPDPKYFDTATIPVTDLARLLRSKAVLLPGLEVTFTIEAAAGDAAPKIQQWRYNAGLADYLTELAKGEPSLVPIFAGENHAGEADDTFAEGEGVAWALSWYEDAKGDGEAFVNLIPTPLGGTHVSGMRAAVFGAVTSFIDHHSLLPKGLKLQADDVSRNVRFVLSVRMLDPQFSGQTKDRLTSREGVRLVERKMTDPLEIWLNQHVGAGKTIAELAIRQALARTRAAKTVERKRSSSVVMLPGKLADCESSNPAETEIFLVEGDSAGGSAKMARNKETQAILPLRGKGMNVWEKDVHQAMENEEIRDLTTALGVPPHTRHDSIDWGKLRYGTVAIMSDADVDGQHIQTLLLTLFFRHFPQLIDRGHVYIAQPPLYRMDVDSAGKKRQAKKLYAMDRLELESWEDRLRKEGYTQWKVGRFKGLGEMDPSELWETTLNPDTRRLLRVMLPDDERDAAVERFNLLMAKARSGARREWMERRGSEVDED
ncbi:MAG: DNA topoisomerase IV subunit B [Casimicrobiaceae bacterium]